MNVACPHQTDSFKHSRVSLFGKSRSCRSLPCSPMSYRHLSCVYLGITNRNANLKTVDQLPECQYAGSSPPQRTRIAMDVTISLRWRAMIRMQPRGTSIPSEVCKGRHVMQNRGRVLLKLRGRVGLRSEPRFEHVSICVAST
jgi:hypothetical protein